MDQLFSCQSNIIGSENRNFYASNLSKSCVYFGNSQVLSTDIITSSVGRFKSDIANTKTVNSSFVLCYEPIQTRKQSRLFEKSGAGMDAGLPIGELSVLKDISYKIPRSRLARSEAYLPDCSPRPKAVPKNMLILEPEMLPRSIKKKRCDKFSKTGFVSSKCSIQAFRHVPNSLSVLLPTSDINCSNFYVSSESVSDDAKVDGEKLPQFSVRECGEKQQEFTEDIMSGAERNKVCSLIGQKAAGTTMNASVSLLNEISEIHTSGSLLLLAEAAYPSTESGQSGVTPSADAETECVIDNFANNIALDTGACLNHEKLGKRYICDGSDEIISKMTNWNSTAGKEVNIWLIFA